MMPFALRHFDLRPSLFAVRYSPCLRASVVIFFILFQLATLGAQVTCLPAFPKTDDAVTITFDASQGNGALAGV